MNRIIVVAALSALSMQVGCLPDTPPAKGGPSDTGGPGAPGDPGVGDMATADGAAIAPTMDTDGGPPISTPDLATNAPKKVGVFIAQGTFGRTTISCDDGHTWVGNHSWDLDADPMMCSAKQTVTCSNTTCPFSPGPSNTCQQTACCIDSPGTPKGIAYGNGTFVASWGWGGGGWGTVRTSTNGVDWKETYKTGGFGDVAYGAGHFVAASPSAIWSADGSSWTGAKADYRDSAGAIVWSVRRMGYADYMGGRFITYATPNPAQLISSDGGKTWWKPSVWPAACAAGGISTYGDIIYGNNTIVIVDYAGMACRSTDGGVTWSTSPTGVTTILSRGVFTGTEFRFWGQGIMISSTDGVNWKQTALPGSPWIEGPVVRSPDTGTYAAVGNIWDGYAKQRLLRSTDGVNWETLAAGTFVASHPLMYMTYGYVDASPTCPAP
jgi:hypothetical protein